MKKNSKRRSYLSVYTIAMLVFLIVYAVSLLYMYIWGVLTSVKTVDMFKKNILWLPDGLPWTWEWKNYKIAFQNFQSHDMLNASGITYRIGFIGMLYNTMIYSLVQPVINLSCTWAMAYICSQFKDMKASKFVFSLNMVLMMIPVVGTMPSAIQIYKTLGLYDTWGWMCMTAIGFVGSNFIIFYAFLRTIAAEMREAAVIDGAGNFTIMLRIIFPLSINMFAILYVTSFIGHWNDYMTMIIWLPSKPSLAYGMYRFQYLTGKDLTWPPIQVAGCVILMLPVLTLFVILKDKILGGVTIGTLK